MDLKIEHAPKTPDLFFFKLKPPCLLRGASALAIIICLVEMERRSVELLS